MAGAAAVRSFTDARGCACLCLDSMVSGSLSVKTNVDLVLSKNLSGRRNMKKLKSVDLGSSFLDTRSTKRLSCGTRGSSKKKKKLRHLSIVDEFGGQYEEGFDDVKDEIINYLTYKAVRTVLNQLYEMNPPKYTWFHNFVADNVPNTGKGFLQKLAKERQDLAERVMITRLHLYGKWIKACNHGEIYNKISDQNLELMRERLMETIIWPSDETNTEKRD
ncbi:chaperonin-like RbcX protein 2, chloroplastic [Coffea arabica]|uniref:Chaperonin-like RbcX protein 2, chloroplastic n=1 Tax=Coffea arabica TaxID=13443 RepID=A0ABM4WIU5_COFAR